MAHFINELEQTLIEFEDRSATYPAVACGKWMIAKGGYDLFWELYYSGFPIAQCISNRVSIMCEDELRKDGIDTDKVLDCIKKCYPDIIIEEKEA